MSESTLNILVPIAGGGGAFKNAGYSFPKPLIDVAGKTMIEVVVNNLRPSVPHRFIFVCLKDQYDQYDLYHILQRATRDQFEVIPILGKTEGAACTALLASRFINNENELVIANGDQFLEYKLDDFIAAARAKSADGEILTFPSSHPKWSYARVSADNQVTEVAEKKVISEHATAGIYYFKHGTDFVKAAQNMIHKDIRHNGEFYICPTFNELILANQKVYINEVAASTMHGMGTPEELNNFVAFVKEKNVVI